MPQWLEEIELEEVSVVDNPANQHAHVLLIKADGRAGRDADSDGVKNEDEKGGNGKRGTPAAKPQRTPARPRQSQRVEQLLNDISRGANTQIIPETRGAPDGALLGAVAGIGAGAAAGSYAGRNANRLAGHGANALRRGGDVVGRAAGLSAGRVAGATVDAVSRGRLNTTDRFGLLGQRAGGAIGRTAGRVAGGVLRTAADVFQRSAGRRAGLIAGVAGAALAAGPGSSFGEHLGRTYDQYSYRRVEKMADENGNIVTLTKSDGSSVKVDAEQAGESIESGVNEVAEDVMQLTGALKESVMSIVSDESGADKGALLDQTFEQFTQAFIEYVAGSEGETPEQDVPGVVEKIFMAGLAAAVPASGTSEEGITKMSKMTPLLVRLAKAEMSPEELEYMNGLSEEDKVKFAEATPEQRKSMMAGEVAKSADVDALVAKALGTQEQLLKSALARLEAFEKKDELATIEADLKKCGQPLEMATTLLDVKKSNPTAYDVIIKGYQAQHEQVKKSGMFREIGSGNGNGSHTGGGEFLAKAAEIRKNQPNLSQAQAIAKAMTDDPASYEAYLREHGQ